MTLYTLYAILYPSEIKVDMSVARVRNIDINLNFKQINVHFMQTFLQLLTGISAVAAILLFFALIGSSAKRTKTTEVVADFGGPLKQQWVRQKSYVKSKDQRKANIQQAQILKWLLVSAVSCGILLLVYNLIY